MKFEIVRGQWERVKRSPCRLIGISTGVLIETRKSGRAKFLPGGEETLLAAQTTFKISYK